MRRFVPLKMGLLPKGLVAKAAAKWPHILVHSHMNHQIVGFGKGLATHFPVFKDPIAGFVVANGLVDVGHVVGLHFMKATVVVAHLGHHSGA